MRNAWIILMLIIGGCATTTVLPQRWQLSVPSASGANMEPGTVWLRHDGKSAEDGNSYVIKFNAATSPCADEAISADLSTNRLPARRCHIDLSIDGGSNWIRRIGYGVQADAAMVTAEFTWSPPEDYSLLTTNARLRAVSLDGGPWPARVPAHVYDLPAGQYPVSFTFPIVGATITNPAAGSILWQGNAATINWIQSGGGPVWNLYWLTPDSAGIDISHWLTTISNVVEGVNSKVVSLNTPAAEQVKLAIVSSLHPSIIGYSKIFTVDP